MSRVVITGAGIVSPIGIGRNIFWSNLTGGVSGVRATECLSYPGMKGPIQAAMVEADLSALLPCRQSVWNGTRTTSFALAAARLALDDAGLDLTTLDLKTVGIAFGTTLSCLSLMSRYDRQAIEEGPRLANPGVFPDTGFSAPSCRLSVLLGPCAFNVTLSNGETSVLDAIEYACTFIRAGRAEMVLVGGSEELSPESMFGFANSRRAKAKATTDGQENPRRNARKSPAYGEGAAVVVLESMEHAQRRSCRVLSEILSSSSTCEPLRIMDPRLGVHHGRLAVQNALNKAQVQPQQIDFVCCGANSSRGSDAVEARVLDGIFGARKPLRTAPKVVLGDSYSAGGAMQVVTASLALHTGVVPPTASKDPGQLRRGFTDSGQASQPQIGLVTSFATTGANAALVLKSADVAGC